MENENLAFYALYPVRLAIEHLFSLNVSTIEYAKPVINSIGGVPQAIFSQLERNNSLFGAQMNKATKSNLTEPVTEGDTGRDDLYAEIKRNVNTASLASDPAKKAAGKALKIFLGPYWHMESKALNTETGVFFELFEKYNASETLKAQAATIGIADMMAGLEAANAGFGILYMARDTQETAKKAPSASSLKNSAVYSYNQFCTSIEQAANYNPSDTLTALFNKMDKLRKTYAKLMPKEDKGEEGQEGTGEVE
jgi:hypothetical protein